MFLQMHSQHPLCGLCSMSTLSFEYSPLAEFRWLPNVYSTDHPDRLYQSNKGSGETLTVMVEQKMRPVDMTRVNEYIVSQPPFPGLKLPSCSSFFL